MFADDDARPTPGKMEARQEVRMHREDEQRIRAAALATGVQEADFIRQAALRMAADVERRLSLSVLPVAGVRSLPVRRRGAREDSRPGSRPPRKRPSAS